MATLTELTDDALKKVQAQLECPICLQPCTDPKMLSCFHVYCKHCLNQIVVKSRDQSTVTCPQCQRATPLPQSGVTGLQDAFHVHQLFEIRDTLEKVKSTQKKSCDNQRCNKTVAVGYCCECSKFVCERCITAHEILELDSHQIVSISNAPTDTATSVTPTAPKRKAMTCPRHSENPLKIYCETCQEFICVDCIIHLHKHHQYEMVPNVYPKARSEIVAQLDSARGRLDAICKAIVGINTRSDEIREQRQVIEADINRQIEILQQKLVGQLDQLTQQKLKNLASQKSQLEMFQTELSSYLECVDGILRSGTDREIVAMKADVCREIQQLAPDFNPGTLNPCEMPDVILVGTTVPKEHEEFAVITNNSSAHMYPMQVGDTVEIPLPTKDKGGYSVPATRVSAELVTSASVEVRKRDDGQCHLACQPATRGRHHLHIMVGGRYTSSSPHTIVVQPRLCDLGQPAKVVDGLQKPWGVTTNSKGMIILVENGASCVSALRPDGEKVWSVGSNGCETLQFNFPCCVTVDSNDNIYVADRDNNRIQKLTPNGEHISYVGSRGRDDLQFYHPVGIGFNPTNNRIYVGDEDNHRIVVLDTNLAFSYTFGSQGNANGQFRNPIAIAFDGSGNVYVADCLNHRIQVFTPDGQYLRQFGHQGSAPCSIAIDMDRVYVTERDNSRVSIFTITGEFLHSFATKGQEPGQLDTPFGVTVTHDGFILVSDCGNNRIQFF